MMHIVGNITSVIAARLQCAETIAISIIAILLIPIILWHEWGNGQGKWTRDMAWKVL